MPTQLIAGDNQNEASFAGGNDGALEVRIGPAGSKATGLSVSSVGDVAALGKLTQKGGAPVPRMLLLPVKATTTGTFIDFSPSDGTGIPSWVKRITVMFNGVSTNGTSALLVQIGSGSIQSTAYSSVGNSVASTVGTLTSTAGFVIGNGSGANSVHNGSLVISLVNGFIYSANGGVSDLANSCSRTGFGGVTLSGTLDRIRLTTVNGTDTFDAGSISILVEGYE